MVRHLGVTMGVFGVIWGSKGAHGVYGVLTALRAARGSSHTHPPNPKGAHRGMVATKCLTMPRHL